jgi:hypothetical protein
MKKIVFLSLLSLTFITGCHPYGGGVIINDGYAHRPLPPRHGHRLHRYYYYPNAEIYFDVGRNMYFYLNSAGAWTFSVNLPVHLRSHLRNAYVEVEMEYDRPYLRHKYYKNKYKKNKRYIRKYNNGRKYRDDRILRHDSGINDRKYQNNLKYDDRKYRNERKYDERKFRNEQKYDARKQRNENQYKEREYKNERRDKYNENKMRKNEQKYEKNDDDNKRGMKTRRNELY